jgi:hypothetical protein
LPGNECQHSRLIGFALLRALDLRGAVDRRQGLALGARQLVLKFTHRKVGQTPLESMSNPSARGVARKLCHAGSSISHQTVNRWWRQGWQPLDREQQHPLETACGALDDAVPLLTGDPITTAKLRPGEHPG